MDGTFGEDCVWGRLMLGTEGVTLILGVTLMLGTLGLSSGSEMVGIAGEDFDFETLILGAEGAAGGSTMAITGGGGCTCAPYLVVFLRTGTVS